MPLPKATTFLRPEKDNNMVMVMQSRETKKEIKLCYFLNTCSWICFLVKRLSYIYKIKNILIGKTSRKDKYQRQ